MKRPALLILSAALFLAGCASVPTSGQVNLGANVTGGNSFDAVVPVVRPPRVGDSPVEIVSGFLQANVSASDDYAVARAYLAPEVTETWNPATGATIINDSNGLQLVRRGSRVLLSEPKVGQLSAVGTYVPSPRNTQLDTDFTVRQVDGQWRIDGVRDGLLLTPTTLNRVYTSAERYFLNTDESRLVPDRILVPIDRRGLLTSLVRGLLTGPSAWLAPAVRTAVPAGTKLDIDAVPIEGTTAVVDLTQQALAANDNQRRILAAQIVWTVTSIETVTAVRITVNGQPLPLAGLGDVLSRKDFAGVDPDGLSAKSSAFVVVGKRLNQITTAGIAPVAGVFGEGSVQLGRVAIDLAQSRAGSTVSVPEAQSTIYLADLKPASQVTPVAGQGAALSLSYSVAGDLWVASQGTVRIIKASGKVSRVRVNGLAAPVLVRVARDGARALVIASSGGQRQVYLMRIVRSEGQYQLETPQLLQNTLAAIVDCAWNDANTAVLIGSSRTGVTQVYSVSVGTPDVSAAGGVASMSAITAAPGSALLVEAPSGVWENSGLGWRLSVARGKSPAYPG